MSADPILSRIFAHFDGTHSAQLPSETGRIGVHFVSQREESKVFTAGTTHEYILEHLQKNPSVLTIIDYYSEENLAGKVTSMKNVQEAARVILSTLKEPLSEDTRYFYQLMALVYRMYFNHLKATEQATEIEKYGLTSDLIKEMKESLKIEDPHQKYAKLNLLLPDLKGLHDIEQEQNEIEVKFHRWNYRLNQEKHAHERRTVNEAQLVYDFFFQYKFILGLAAVVGITNSYLFRAERFTFKTALAIAGWTVYSSSLVWIGLNLVGMVIKKMVRVTSPVFRYYIPAPKPPLHPLSKSMSDFIEENLPKCYQARLPQLIPKWQEAVLVRYFSSKQAV